jgi:hypothetical protein
MRKKAKHSSMPTSAPEEVASLDDRAIFDALMMFDVPTSPCIGKRTMLHAFLTE